MLKIIFYVYCSWPLNNNKPHSLFLQITPVLRKYTTTGCMLLKIHLEVEGIMIKKCRELGPVEWVQGPTKVNPVHFTYLPSPASWFILGVSYRLSICSPNPLSFQSKLKWLESLMQTDNRQFNSWLEVYAIYKTFIRER